MDKTWAVRIEDLERRGWSQSAIGKDIGLSPGAVGDIKSGRTKQPTGMAAIKLHALHASKKKCRTAVHGD